MPSVGLHPSLDAAAVLEREVSFRNVCSRSLGQQTFYDALRQASSAAGALDTSTKRAAQVMGLDADFALREHDHVDDLLLALAPSHRLSLLHVVRRHLVG